MDKRLEKFTLNHEAQEEYVLDAEQILSSGDDYGLLEPRYIAKKWGYELVHINTHAYCCKRLHIDVAQKTSKHFHLNKHETMVVTSGILIINLYNKDLMANRIVLVEGDSFVIPGGLVHSLEAGSDFDVDIIECSTFSLDSDSYRIE